MTNYLVGAAVTILLAIITYMVKLSSQVQKNTNMIIEEKTRSISEDKHHKSELDKIEKQLAKIINKLEILTKELLGNGK